MTIEKALFIFAGSMAVLSGLLTLLHSPYWAYFTIFIGLNMVQSRFTGFCPPSWLMKKAGMKTEAETAASQNPPLLAVD